MQPPDRRVARRRRGSGGVDKFDVGLAVGERDAEVPQPVGGDEEYDEHNGGAEGYPGT
jgi:hypothetical protein